MNLLLLAPGYQAISTTPKANAVCSVGLLLCFFLAVFVFLALFSCCVIFSRWRYLRYHVQSYLIYDDKAKSPKKRPLSEAALGPLNVLLLLPASSSFRSPCFSLFIFRCYSMEHSMGFDGLNVAPEMREYIGAILTVIKIIWW